MNEKSEQRWRRRRRKKRDKWIANEIGCEGAMMISEMLKINSSLNEINLGGSGFEDGKLSFFFNFFFQFFKWKYDGYWKATKLMMKEQKC